MQSKQTSLTHIPEAMPVMALTIIGTGLRMSSRG
jgi:hypothetical protein